MMATAYIVAIFLIFCALIWGGFVAVTHRNRAPLAPALNPYMPATQDAQETVSCSSFSKMSIDAYLKSVYGECAQRKNIWQLSFFYACCPAEVIAHYGVYLPWKHNYRPPPVGILWPPVWTPACAFLLNRVHPQSFWTIDPQVADLRDTVEGYHTRDDNTFYAVEGLWVYAGQGAGVMYKLGKTLRVPCKILAFLELGLSLEDLASLIHNTGMEAMPNVSVSIKIEDVAKRYFTPPSTFGASAQGSIWSITRLLTTMQKLYTRGEKGGFSSQALYDMDRVNNSAGYDTYLILMARAAGWDSVQFLRQANGNGGWAHEVVLLQANILYKLQESAWPGWRDISKNMLDGCGNPCQPDFSKWMTLCKRTRLPAPCLGDQNALPRP